MSTKLPKTPPSSEKVDEGKGETKRAIDEVIDTPEALKRAAKRTKSIVEEMSEKPNVGDQIVDNSSDLLGIEDTRPNIKRESADEPRPSVEREESAEPPLWDISDFGCHEHAEEKKGSNEHMVEKSSPSGTPRPSNVKAKSTESS